MADIASRAITESGVVIGLLYALRAGELPGPLVAPVAVKDFSAGSLLLAFGYHAKGFDNAGHHQGMLPVITGDRPRHVIVCAKLNLGLCRLNVIPEALETVMHSEKAA